MYRKLKKACWVHSCEACNVRSTYVDQFGAYAADWDHKKLLSHSMASLESGLSKMAESFENLAKAFQKSFANSNSEEN